jgi:glycosyltransferase involved in cell wall biosynthesis
LKTLLCLGHDANRAGAQLVLLDLLRRLRHTGRYRLHLLLGAGGPLLPDYEAVATVTLWPDPAGHLAGPLADKILFRLGFWPVLIARRQTRQRQKLADQLRLDEVDLVLVNTVSSAKLFRQLMDVSPALPGSEAQKNRPVVTFVHELAMAVAQYSQPDDLRFLLDHTTQLLAVSPATANYYVDRHGTAPAQVQLFTLIDIPGYDRRIAHARTLTNPYAELSLPPGAVIVGGCGNAEWRKGCDLFITLARLTVSRLIDNQQVNPAMLLPSVCFVWVGMPPGAYADQLRADIEKAGLTDVVRLLPPTPDVLRYSTRFDLFALTSREDPYPLVVFEAGLSGVPVVCFAGAGGAPDLVETTGGRVVPYLALDDMSRQVADWVCAPAERARLGAGLNQTIRQRHNPADAMATLEAVFDQLPPAR